MNSEKEPEVEDVMNHIFFLQRNKEFTQTSLVKTPFWRLSAFTTCLGCLITIFA